MCWRENRPHPFQGLPERKCVPKSIVHGFCIDFVTCAVCEGREHLGLDVLTRCIVCSVAMLGLFDNLLALEHRQPEILQAEPDDEIRSETTLTLTNRTSDHVDHPKITFDRGRVLGVETIGPNTWNNQVAQYGEADACLTERWKNLFDVGEEEAVRTEDKYTLVLQREPVGVEQIRRSM